MNFNSYNFTDIVNSLVTAGLREGDTAYFSTSLGMIGKAKNQVHTVNELFLRAIKTVLGKTGTILIPSYSYTFSNSTQENPKIFDPKTSPTRVGPFPQYFLEQKGVVRSLDPMVSMAGHGPSSSALFKNLPPTSYGEDCLYARLVNHPNTKCVSIGLGPNWIPFLHHAEWLARVPFRYEKKFYGAIKKNSGLEYLHWVYAVRAPMEESRADGHELGKRATEAGIWSYVPLARARVYTCDYKELFEYTMQLISTDKWLTAKGPPREIPEEN